LEGVFKGLKEKINTKEQADRFIVNLGRSNFTPEDVADILLRKSSRLPTLEEIKIITKSGETIDIYPN